MELRQAVPGDTEALKGLIDASIRGLAQGFYTPAQIEASIGTVFGVDSTMIADGTYFVVEEDGALVGAGGWSFRKTPFGGDAAGAVRDAAHRDPATEAAIIRAYYVHPDHVRRGIGRLMMQASEDAARAAGFRRLELVATLSGIAFYEHLGYRQVEPLSMILPGQVPIDFVRMEKS